MSGEVNAISNSEVSAIPEPSIASAPSAGVTRNNNDIRDRFRNDGLQTVSKLLHESRAENKILKEKNIQLERAVDGLSSKLQKSGLSGVGGEGGERESRIPSNHTFDEDRLPSSSRQLVENLIRENNRLKHQIHNPQKIDELNLRACSLQSLNNSLKDEKARLDRELEVLKSAIARSDSDKDKHILQLTNDLKHCRLEHQQEQSLRLTLEGEINKLNDELTDTAQKCLNMRKYLPSSMSSAPSTSAPSTSAPSTMSQFQSEKPVPISQPVSLPTGSQTQVANERILYEQNTRLEIKCNNLEKQLKFVCSASTPKANKQLVAENGMLKEELTEKDRLIGKLKENCQVLSHQLHAFQEDFKKERRGREKLLKDCTYLEEHVTELKGQLSARNNPVNNAWDGRQQAASRPRTGQQAVRFNVQPVKSQSSKDNQPKSASKSAAAQPIHTHPINPVDGEDNNSLSSQTDVVRPTLPNKQQTDLACYKCDKRFGQDKHSELIDHLDVCNK